MTPGDRRRIELMDLTCRSRPYDTRLLRALRSAGVDARLWLAGCSEPLTSSGSAPNVQPLIDLAGKLPPGRMQRGAKAMEYLANLLLLLGEIHRHDPHILHVQWLPLLEVTPSLELRLLRHVQRRGIRVVYTVHNVLPHGTGQRHRSAFREAYLAADALICHTEHARTELVNDFGIPEEKVRKIPHGPLMTDIIDFSRARCRSALGLDADTVQVLLFGILRPYKGIDFLLRTWRRLAERVTDTRLVIAGSAEPDFRERMDGRIRELGLERHVQTIYGFLPDPELKTLIQASDIVVYPYEQVTQSGALLAGMTAGKAIIATDLEGFRETLRDGETGLLVEYDDEPAFAGALERLARSSGARERLGDAARTDVRERFSWSRIAEMTTECYEELLPPA